MNDKTKDTPTQGADARPVAIRSPDWMAGWAACKEAWDMHDFFQNADGAESRPTVGPTMETLLHYFVELAGGDPVAARAIDPRIIAQVQIYLATRDATPTVDARPAAIYQIRAGAYRWDDVTKDAWEDTVDNSKRIVYATRDAAPSDAISDEEADVLVLRVLAELQSQFLWDAVTFESGPLSVNKVDSRFTYFAKRLIAASAPMEKT